jgi:arabinan endo-1,5-alpha-L-arabinosidase
MVSLVQGSARAEASLPLNDRLTGDLSPVHDPCIIREGDTYHVFCTTMMPPGWKPPLPPSDGAAPSGPPPGWKPPPGQISWRTSTDLVNWKYRGYALSNTPEWLPALIPGARGLWAPDISYYSGRFWLYYAGSTFGSNRSAIGLATNRTLNPDSPDYRWTDEGLVLESHESDTFNAIDPAHIVDRDGGRWLAFGSFWSGIKLVRLDRKSGKPPAGPLKLRAIASRMVPDDAPSIIEAPFGFERGGYHYLLASFDYCCKGVNSTYYTVIGRSRNVQGPYVDKRGRPMTEGYGVVLLRADLSEKGRWRGPGHSAILRDPGQDYIVYHAYDSKNNGMATLRIAPLVWSADGWPTAIV